jgi:hypothetical protein
LQIFLGNPLLQASHLLRAPQQQPTPTSINTNNKLGKTLNHINELDGFRYVSEIAIASRSISLSVGQVNDAIQNVSIAAPQVMI